MKKIIKVFVQKGVDFFSDNISDFSEGRKREWREVSQRALIEKPFVFQ